MRKVAPSRRSLGPARSSIPEATITTVDSASAGAADRIALPQGPGPSPTVTRAIEVRTVDAAQHLALSRRASGSFLQTPAWGRLKNDWRAESVGWFDGRRDGRRRLVLYRLAAADQAGRSPTSPRARSSTGPRHGSSTCSAPCATTSRPRAPSRCGSVRRRGAPLARRTIKAAIADDGGRARYDEAAPDVDRGCRYAPSSPCWNGSASGHLASDDGFAAGQPEYVFQLPLAGRTEADVLAGMNQLWRRNIKKSAKHGVEVTPRRRRATCRPSTRIRRDRRARPLHAAAARVLRAHVRGHGGRGPGPDPPLPRPPRRATSSPRRLGPRRRARLVLLRRLDGGQARGPGVDRDPVADDAGRAGGRRRRLRPARHHRHRRGGRPARRADPVQGRHRRRGGRVRRRVGPAAEPLLYKGFDLYMRRRG